MTNMNMIETKQGKPCLIDYNGKIWLEPRVDVDTLSYPMNGRAIVGKDGKYGYINEYGVLVIPMKYKQAYPFAENGLAFVVCENGLGGYIDKEGRFVIDPIYETGSLFRFGFAAVSKNGEYIYIYNNGKKAINNTFKYAGGFSECGLAKVIGFDGHHALMDTTSLVVLSLKLGCELDAFQDGARITTFRKDGREALINAAGEIINGYYEKVIISPYNRLHPFLRNGLWGYIDNRGNEVIPNIYKEVAEFEEYTQYKIAAVKSYHPLAKDNVVNFYINEQDEIIDTALIEKSRQHLNEKFSKVNRYKAQLALAVKNEAEKVKTSIKGGVNEMRKNYNNEESNENEQTGKDESTYHEEYEEIYDAQKDTVHVESEEVGHDARHDDLNDEQMADMNKSEIREADDNEVDGAYAAEDEVNSDAYNEVDESETDEDEPVETVEDEANSDAYNEVNEADSDERADADEDDAYLQQFDDDIEMGRLYEVKIFFRNMPFKREIYHFLNNELEAGIMIVEINVNYARLYWPIDDWEDPADIENAMYYLMDDVRLGEYKYAYVDSYYHTTNKNRLEDL